MDSQQIQACLAQPHAPHGDPATDLKTALYLACCSRTLDLNNALSLGALGLELGELGYAGNLETLDYGRLRGVLDELTGEGALCEVRPGAFHIVTGGDGGGGELTAVLRYETPPGGEGGFCVEDDEGRLIGVDVLNFLVLPGDEVSVLRLGGDRAMVRSITAQRQFVLGRPAQLSEGGSERWVLMVDEHALRGYSFVFAAASDVGEARAGDVVIARITSRQHRRIQVQTSEVVHSLGSLDRFILEAVIANDIPNVWPSGMGRELAAVPDHVREEDWRGRVDLRELPLMTIDGEDARDFDDAVHARREGRGFRLHVAIADVSYYVRPGSLLDREALNRCNSVYFPNYVIPMLPEKLSNGICSLNPDVDRLCMVCEMLIDREGQVTEYSFYPAVMNSHARLTYTEAWQMISEGTAHYPEHEPCIAAVRELHELYQVLRRARIRRGAVNAESDEVTFIFNEKLEITGIDPIERNDAHMLIEECMIAANVCAARFTEQHQAATLFRVHQKPQPDKLAQLHAALRGLRLSPPGGDQPSPADFSQFLKRQEKRPDFKFLQTLILRAMSKAQYSPDNIGHFGLALGEYAHFTSPIRRYPDLQLHRVIKQLLRSGSGPGRGLSGIGERSYGRAELEVLGLRCTRREIAAQRAEFDVDGRLKCTFLANFLGYQAEGVITGVSSFGVFVYLDKFCISGLIYIGNLERGTFVTHEEDKGRLVSSKRTYKIGDRLVVTIAAVNAEEGKVDLVPYEQPKPKRRRRRSRSAAATAAAAPAGSAAASEGAEGTTPVAGQEDARLSEALAEVDRLIAARRRGAVSSSQLRGSLQRSSMTEHLDTCTRRRRTEGEEQHAQSTQGRSYLDVVRQAERERP